MRSYECVPNFLTADEADRLFTFMQSQSWQDRHAHEKRISYGPQVYPVRCGTNPDVNQQSEPVVIASLRTRLATYYGVPFNSVECHLHDAESVVSPHFDAYGMIAMVRVGATRPLVVKPPKELRLAIILEHGSLLTFFGKVQQSMHPTPGAGQCVSLVFRFVTEPLTKKGWNKNDDSKRRHKQMYDAAVRELGTVSVHNTAEQLTLEGGCWDETKLGTFRPI
jgi:hypothetical protein